jgi:hypothetical protein
MTSMMEGKHSGKKGENTLGFVSFSAQRRHRQVSVSIPGRLQAWCWSCGYWKLRATFRAPGHDKGLGLAQALGAHVALHKPPQAASFPANSPIYASDLPKVVHKSDIPRTFPPKVLPRIPAIPGNPPCLHSWLISQRQLQPQPQATRDPGLAGPPFTLGSAP